MAYKRVFLIVLDSVGIGEAPDAKNYGDEGSNTIKSITKSSNFHTEVMKNMGLFNIDGIDFGEKVENPIGAYCKLQEQSKGKDTTTGHWEIAGKISSVPFPTYPNGFPTEVIDEFEKQTGRKVLCNKPYSGTEVIKDYGKEHVETGNLIVYTSADSVFQIAAHEKIVPVEKLYEYCKIARKILQGEHAVGRVIARPFEGDAPNFYRTANRHDFSLVPEGTVLNNLKENGKDVIAIGKINDIFAGSGITEHYYTHSNEEGMHLTLEMAKKDFEGLCFTNLVDFDMLYGHRNDVDGYAKAFTEVDNWLKTFVNELKEDDVLMITADHGCDPATPSTDHSREYIPLLIYGKKVNPVNLGVRNTFSDIGKTIADNFKVKTQISGTSFLEKMEK